MKIIQQHPHSMISNIDKHSIYLQKKRNFFSTLILSLFEENNVINFVLQFCGHSKGVAKHKYSDVK